MVTGGWGLGTPMGPYKACYCINKNAKIYNLLATAVEAGPHSHSSIIAGAGVPFTLFMFHMK